MSCGGSSATNRNAQAIRDAMRRQPGAVTTRQARALFHRLADGARAELHPAVPAGRGDASADTTRLTQEVHVLARARLGGELAAIDAVHRANNANTLVMATDASDWVGQDSALAGLFTPAQAAADVRRARRDQVVEGFTDRYRAAGADAAAAEIDSGPVDPGRGDGVAVLAGAADGRAVTARNEREGEEWTRVAARLRRVAALQGAFGQAELAGAENFERAVDHALAYGPGLQARWEALPALERVVISLRCGHPDGDNASAGPLGPVETARRLGLDRETVRRLESKGRWRLAQE